MSALPEEEMRSLSNLGIGLSLVFGCLLLALIAELYYLLWWKRRINNGEIDDYNSSAREFMYLFCWKKPSSLSSTAVNPQQLCNSIRMADTQGHESENHLNLQSNSSKDFLLKPYGEDSIEGELMRLHNLSGPTRFLFTIKEETKEDLESEDGKSRGDKSRKGSRNRSLSDLFLTVETPFLTPLSSPAFFTPPHTPIDSYNHHGFNPLFESSTDAEINNIKASPPPKFKFLKDAEEKLQRRILMEQDERRVKRSSGSFEDNNKTLTPPSKVKVDEDGSYITILVSKPQEKEAHQSHNHHHHHHYSSSSQVLPLSSSPSAIRSTNKKPMST